MKEPEAAATRHRQGPQPARLVAGVEFPGNRGSQTTQWYRHMAGKNDAKSAQERVKTAGNRSKTIRRRQSNWPFAVGGTLILATRHVTKSPAELKAEILRLSREYSALMHQGNRPGYAPAAAERLSNGQIQTFPARPSDFLMRGAFFRGRGGSGGRLHT